MSEDETKQTCEGHECDGCKTCSLGRCCRRDNPDYQLPSEGDWQPFIGEIGRLTTDGVKAECHICGGYFGRLGYHVTVGHDVTADEYKALFGLKRGQGLSGPAYASKMAILGQAHGDLLRTVGAEAMASMTREQRQHWTRSRRISAQERQGKTARGREQRLADMVCTVCGKAWVADGYEERERRTCGDRDCINRRIGELNRTTGEYSAFAPRVAECAVCGVTFVAGSRVTCSDTCDSERRRRVALDANVARRPEVRKKISRAAARRVIDRDAKGRIRGWTNDGKPLYP